MRKKELRIKYKDLRNGLTPEILEEQSLALANQLIQLHVWDKTYYHLYLTIEEQKEVNTEFILQILAGKDKEIIVSKCDFSTLAMTHYLLTDNTKFRKNKYNIPEPVDGLEVPTAKIEVVFVPLLAYDVKGNRVGYGKGFYDVFLKQCAPNTLKIGLSFFEPERYIEDIQATDIPLDFVITPNKIYSFSANN
ncbi:5-formyltetrahydrofolate cyclo-ligase [Flavobacterium aciduliphilum]|uniref:5-formyltetrahydrofolate cyclo-ligase n=1 Tax=Flavobacterium aciduliphilum TaxID=1101402 RepID=A0A328YDQ4_9FLAO|nr:5-formyltetrahydrofolate cyclo-ligase [Flavobacterium aciduliphilum]RAR71273.1 5-formyltetrahydrofolate cyclo-ligase [Flavobacterium aciduliphilum]